MELKPNIQDHGLEPPVAAPSLPTLRPAAFNDPNIFCQLNSKLGTVSSLDVLASNNVLFRDADNHCVVPLTIFHYTMKGINENWNADHAIVLTIADLFCDEVPDHLRSTDAVENLAESARGYISRMPALCPQWSSITVRDYKAVLKKNPNWPTIANPDLTTKGSAVPMDKLFEAWVFCFKHASNDAYIKINPGILSLLFCYASHGEDLPKNVDVVNRISKAMGCTGRVNEEFMNSIVKNIIPIVSIDNAQRLYDNYVKSLPVDIARKIKERMERLVSVRLKHLSLVMKARQDFTGFAWDSLGALLSSELNALTEAQRLVAKSRYFGLIHNKNAASSENFKTLAHTARKLYGRESTESFRK